MVVGFKDSFKLIGMTIVSFCAVLVCTFFLNFYLDAITLKGTFTDPQTVSLYNAQLATSKFTCAISGGCLGVIAVVMLVFYVKLYIDSHAAQLGILKATGYSNGKLSLRFAVFGLSVLLGTALGFGCGYALMPVIYDSLMIEGLPKLAITFHLELLFALVLAPAVVFAGLACLYARFALRRPVLEMMRGKSEKIKARKAKKEKERSFLTEMAFKTIAAKKSLAFFMAFACFCFAAMVQMSVSMLDLNPDSPAMGALILGIGVVLAVTTLLMAMTSLVRGNAKNVAMMKAFGYTRKECALSVFGAYRIFSAIGFAVGTIYQYGLLKVMVEVVYKNVQSVPDYTFNVPVFFITLAVFIVFHEAVMLFFTFRMDKISVKEVMQET